MFKEVMNYILNWLSDDYIKLCGKLHIQDSLDPRISQFQYEFYVYVPARILY